MIRTAIIASAAGVGIAILLFGAPASAKTAKECSAEYSANKAAIKAAGQKKSGFIAACKAGAEAPNAPAAAPAPGTASAPQAPVAAPAPTAAPVTASEAQAQASCPGATVVWVNTKTHIYHFKGRFDYGNTKQGAYMCEAAAMAAGNRAAKNEKHP